MMQPKVTVVIPVYNVENYLDRCVLSVVNQTYQNLEIILVDDGSPDSCPQICDRWAEKDPRIQVIHKQNAGLGFARNSGMEKATGDYICFYDSDDYVAEDTIETCINTAEKTQADIVTYGYNKVDPQGRIVGTSIPQSPKCVYRDEEIESCILPALLVSGTAIQGVQNLALNGTCSLFSMKLISSCNWHFVSERQFISEDRYSLLMLYRFVHTVAVIKRGLYYYCENEASLTHVFRTDRFQKNNECYEASLELVRKLRYSEEIQRAIASPYFSDTISTMKILTASHLCKKEKREKLLKMLQDPVLHFALKRIDLRRENRNRQILILTIRLRFYRIAAFLIKVKS